ncbi:nuclease-related domain-containing protein [uncultured Fibrobacter sp.]|uniref:nuclease-related domain-containing protein n=1 Tax=uncultured Fibrobacter sp. TaxID=261512 RepID=UPI0025D3869C|nr:nuclease-related domain-containing protein [uncultured Fibrobacter sp.]
MTKFVTFFLIFLGVISFSNAYIPQNLSPSQIWDKNGVTLTKAFESAHKSTFSIQRNRCNFFETQINGVELEYEINNCHLKHSLQKATSRTDRQLGIEIKGTIWIDGDSFRTRSQNGVWSGWKSFRNKFKYNKIGYNFQKRNGNFDFIPTTGAIMIHWHNTIINKNKIHTQNKSRIVFLLTPFIFFALLVFIRIYRRKTIGTRGEKYTAKRIKAISNGVIFRDIYVNGSHGVQQIDIIAVTEKGIFVVEKKTYTGLIVGGTYDRQWNVYYYGRQVHLMKNPHHQNYGHIQALRERFPELSNLFIDLVIFGNNAVLGDNIPPMTIYDNDFDYVYASFPSILNDDEIESISYKIAALDNRKAQLKETHKEKIRRINGDW